MSTIDQRATEIVADFAMFDDWMGRYEYLIDLGRDIPPIDPAFKTDAYRIHGCQSQVWIHPELHDGRVRFTADSDALITKGLVSLLLRVLNDQPPEAIIDADLGFIDAIGLQDHLSPNRKNGLASMVNQLKQYALVYRAN